MNISSGDSRELSLESLNDSLNPKGITHFSFGKSLILILAMVGAVLQLFPFIWLLDFSLLKDSEIFTSGILKWPSQFQWMNYKDAWIMGHILPNFINSIIVSGAAVLIVVVFSITMGYLFAKMEWKMRGFFLSVILMGMMIPVYSTLLPNFKLYHDLGMLDSYWVLILPYAAFNLPVGVYIMTGFLETLPKSLEESATIDGCGTYGIIFRIIAPVTKPAIVTIAIMTFIPCWNEFIMAVTYISKDQYKTLPFSVYNFASQFWAQYSKQFAVFMLTAIPIIVLYVLLNEQVTKGATAGAIKG
jgi:raffinose/stachyose/melibiose transport system permease protein